MSNSNYKEQLNKMVERVTRAAAYKCKCLRDADRLLFETSKRFDI